MLILDSTLRQEIRERDRKDIKQAWKNLRKYVKERPELWRKLDPDELFWDRVESRNHKNGIYQIKNRMYLDVGLWFTSDVNGDDVLIKHYTIDQILNWCKGYCKQLQTENLQLVHTHYLKG